MSKNTEQCIFGTGNVIAEILLNMTVLDINGVWFVRDDRELKDWWSTEEVSVEFIGIGVETTTGKSSKNATVAHVTLTGLVDVIRILQKPVQFKNKF